MRYTAAVKADAQQLLTDLRALGLEAEKLIEDQAADLSETAIAKLSEQFRAAQARFSELYGVARERTIAGAKYTDRVVRDNPYRSIGVGAAVGLIVGILVGRSLDSD